MHRHRTLGLRTLLALCILPLTAPGCSEQPGSSSGAASALTSASSEAAEATSAPFDLATAIERARASFYEADGRYLAGGETLRVELTSPATGAFELFPAHDTALEALSDARVGSAEVPRSARSVTTRIEATTPFGARTESIARGAIRADDQLGAIGFRDGALLLSRGAVTEELRNTRDGLEQSWRFAARPEGHEDLVVRVATSGMTHLGTTPAGEHFADSESGLGVRYGHGTWIDAQGTRTSVVVVFEHGALVLRVPSDVVDGSAYPAVLDPTIGPEVAMDTPVTGPRGANQVEPAIASNGSDTYLLVFTDGLFGDDDVRGARFNATGTLLDSRSFPIATSSGNQSAPAVAWNGTNWIVAWQDGRNENDFDLYATTVTAAGAVGALNGAPVAATSPNEEREPALAAAGAVTLLAFRSGSDAASDIVGVRLNTSAVSTDAVPFVIGGGAGVQDAAAVGASASQFLVVYDEDPDGPGGTAVSVRGRRVNAAGSALVDGAPFTVATNSFTADVGWAGGTSYLVVWTGVDAGFFAAFSGAVPVTGAVGAVTPVEVSPSAAGRDYLFPQLAWNGSEYLTVYDDGVISGGMFTEVSIGSRRLTAAGAPTGAALDPTSITGSTSQPDIAAIGANWYIVYVDASGESSDIRGTNVTGTTVSSPAGQLLSSGPNDQTAPIVASSGTVYGVAWTDFRAGAVDAWAATIDAAGAVTGAPSPILSGMGTQSPTGIAWSGTRFLVAIFDEDNLRGVTMTGTGIASTPFVIAASATLSESQGAVACGPAAIGCLVAWTEYDPAAMTIDANLRAARVDASAPIATVGAGAVVVTAVGNQFAAAAAASSTGFYVTWTDGRVMTNVDVRGTRFSTTALDPGGIAIGAAAGDQAAPAVASDGTDFLVAFIDQRSGGMRPNDIFMQRVTAAGTLAGTNVGVATSTDDELEPSLGFSGRYLLTWTRTNGTTGWIEGARVASSGTIIDTTPLNITDPSGLNDLPHVAGGPGGVWLVAYRSFATNTARTVARLVTDDLAIGATCTAGTACASGFCVDGVCCDTACAGGSTDCNACSVAAGGASNGTCGVIAGCGDAGSTDAGSDGGTATDAPDVDGGVGADTGTMGTDAGMMTTDTGGMSTDTGMRADGGVGADAGTPPAAGGCGCTVPARSPRRGSAPVWFGLVVGVSLLARRRR